MKRLTDTRIKLEEAKYFLNRMAEEVANRDPFKYNLSAFLSAARSVTFIMQSECSDVPGFRDWYEEKKNIMRADPLMVFMRDKRNMALKQKAISPRGHITVNITETVVLTEHVVAVLTDKNGTKERIETPQSSPVSPPENKTEATYQWFFEDLPDRDINDCAKEYVIKLEKLIEECELKFI